MVWTLQDRLLVWFERVDMVVSWCALGSTGTCLVDDIVWSVGVDVDVSSYRGPC